MPWARVDDSLLMNRKIKRAWRQSRASMGLFLFGLVYAAGQLTDGVVDREVVREWLPSGPQGKAAVAALVDAGLWAPHPNGWLIHDYLDYNPSAQQIRDERAANANRQAAFRDRRNAVTNAATNGAPSHPIPIEREIPRERTTKTGYTGRGPLGPSHDDANAAGLSWAAIKAERQRQGTEE